MPHQTLNRKIHTGKSKVSNHEYTDTPLIGYKKNQTRNIHTRTIFHTNLTNKQDKKTNRKRPKGGSPPTPNSGTLLPGHRTRNMSREKLPTTREGMGGETAGGIVKIKNPG